MTDSCYEQEGLGFVSDGSLSFDAFGTPSFVEPHLHLVKSVVRQGDRWRLIGRRLCSRPLSETFHDFILRLLHHTLGEDWHAQQRMLAKGNGHVVWRWMQSFNLWAKTNQTDSNKLSGKNIWFAFPSGEVEALLQLAYDLYCLQAMERLPNQLLERLRNRQRFQGCRYEIAVAAMMARAGFEIEFLDETVMSSKHCDLIATHMKSAVKIGIEAKSRHRAGVLNQNGTVDYQRVVRGDVHKLFRESLDQKPKDLPFVIFIDLNVPPNPDPRPQAKPWFSDLTSLISHNGPTTPERPDQYNAVLFTNFSCYYAGNVGSSHGGEWVWVRSPYSATPMNNSEILNEIIWSVERYSNVPTDV